MLRTPHASSRRPLAVGDLCVTCNSENSPRNNGLLVVIVQIRRRASGRLVSDPYVIRRIDGQPFPVLGGPGRRLNIDVFTQAMTRSRHLRRVPSDDTRSELLRVIELSSHDGDGEGVGLSVADA